MRRFDGPADQRDELATDRDDASDRRDLASSQRDTHADRRDVQAVHRDVEADDQAENFDRRLERIRHQIINRLARIASLTIDETAWPDLTSAGLAQLQAHTGEQRRLAALDQAAITSLLDDLTTEVRHGRIGRFSSTRDRLAAAQDRRASRTDREHAGQDRAAAAQDRDQSAIERQQAEPPGNAATTAEPSRACRDEQLSDRVTRVLAESRQRLIDSRARLTRHAHPPDPPPAPAGDAESTEPQQQ